MPEPYIAIQVVMMPKDTNPHGTIFGGVLLANIDMAGAIGAQHEVLIRGGNPRATFVTVAINRVEFKKPVLVGDVVKFQTTLVKFGRTSVTMGIEVIVERGAGAGALIPDAQFEEAGARMVEEPAGPYEADVVVKVAPPTPFASSVTVGTRLPAHATVLGRILLEDLTLPQLRALYPEDKLETFSPSTPKTVDELFDMVQADRTRGAGGEVEHAPLDEGTAVVDRDDDAAAVMGDPQLGAEGQRAMRAGHGVLVEALARCRPAAGLVAVGRGHTGEAVPGDHRIGVLPGRRALFSLGHAAGVVTSGVMMMFVVVSGSGCCGTSAGDKSCGDKQNCRT